jgi:hypothetical protein
MKKKKFPAPKTLARDKINHLVEGNITIKKICGGGLSGTGTIEINDDQYMQKFLAISLQSAL